MPRPRLTPNQNAVLHAYQQGHPLEDIAAEHDVDRSVITRIVKEAGLYTERRGAHWATKREAKTT